MYNNINQPNVQYINNNNYQYNNEVSENKLNIKDNEEEGEEEEEEDKEEDEEINNEIKKDIILYKEKNDIKEKIKNRKCSLTEHIEIDAISFCQRCQIYMCDKCQKVHSGLLKSHFVSNLYQNNNDIFTWICKEKNHINKLEYFCKNHNQLCCTSCITKIKCRGNGKHKNCTIYYISKFKNSKKDKLNTNIRYLEDLSSKLEQSIKELKELFDNISENKENLKMKIQKIFTKIRNTLNDREDELLLKIDEKFNDLFFKEELIKESEKLPNKIKLALEKGKKTENEWNDDNKLSSLINDCLNIEKILKI